MDLSADGTICNDPEQLAAMNANTTMWSPWMQKMVLSDWAVEDGSFLRLATLSIGYTLPQTLTKKVGIQNLRFYATGYNLFCLTKSRQYVIGLNLTF